ncbi:hypothetical protein VNI00_010807 [Paramarasmius palmivorus]|uniref:Zn(2)-C6 fungal-type domain-containing protein n=1 Tax=Paramarasmius palmivorus TaxID=297713 RepID=A0AAW0CFA2_9AGAR
MADTSGDEEPTNEERERFGKLYRQRGGKFKEDWIQTHSDEPCDRCVKDRVPCIPRKNSAGRATQCNHCSQKGKCSKASQERRDRICSQMGISDARYDELEIWYFANLHSTPSTQAPQRDRPQTSKNRKRKNTVLPKDAEPDKYDSTSRPTTKRKHDTQPKAQQSQTQPAPKQRRRRTTGQRRRKITEHSDTEPQPAPKVDSRSSRRLTLAGSSKAVPTPTPPHTPEDTIQPLSPRQYQAAPEPSTDECTTPISCPQTLQDADAERLPPRHYQAAPEPSTDHSSTPLTTPRSISHHDTLAHCSIDIPQSQSPTAAHSTLIQTKSEDIDNEPWPPRHHTPTRLKSEGIDIEHLLLTQLEPSTDRWRSLTPTGSLNNATCAQSDPIQASSLEDKDVDEVDDLLLNFPEVDVDVEPDSETDEYDLVYPPVCSDSLQYWTSFIYLLPSPSKDLMIMTQFRRLKKNDPALLSLKPQSSTVHDAVLVTDAMITTQFRRLKKNVPAPL